MGDFIGPNPTKSGVQYKLNSVVQLQTVEDGAGETQLWCCTVSGKHHRKAEWKEPKNCWGKCPAPNLAVMGHQHAYYVTVLVQ